MDAKATREAFLAMGEHPQENMHLTVTRGMVCMMLKVVDGDSLMITDSLGAELENRW